MDVNLEFDLFVHENQADFAGLRGGLEEFAGSHGTTLSLLPGLQELLHGKWMAVTRIDCGDAHACQLPDTFHGSRHVIHDRAQLWGFQIFDQVTAEQFAFRRPEDDRAPRMPGQSEHSGRPAKPGQVLTIGKRQVGRKAVSLAKPGEKRQEHPDEEARILAAAEHIALLGHPTVRRVHGDPGSVGRPQVSRVADVVEIAVGQQDQLERAGGGRQWLYAISGQLFQQLLPGRGTASVDQKMTAWGGKEVGVYRSHAQGQGECQSLDLGFHRSSFFWILYTSEVPFRKGWSYELWFSSSGQAGGW